MARVPLVWWARTPRRCAILALLTLRRLWLREASALPPPPSARRAPARCETHASPSPSPGRR
eukprot:6502647-Pyramimonas_sp.AAC.1